MRLINDFTSEIVRVGPKGWGETGYPGTIQGSCHLILGKGKSKNLTIWESLAKKEVIGGVGGLTGAP